MYKINQLTNDIEKLEERLFKDLGFRERDHLQEWIAKNPEVLGEDLLIIQKEFSGFNDTNERLDLLALDKEGNLVIIENKLDDSGRNVAWQAIKYASYCSTLTTKQILNLFQKYLDQSQSVESAQELVESFLAIDDEELYLNSGDQRIIFIANHFRKEVTSTVLWLITHSIQVQCFRATPFTEGENIFLQIEQIIPLPETEEFMIDAQEKKREDLEKGQGVISETKITQLEFWKRFKERLLLEDEINTLQTPRPKYWFDIALGKSGIKLSNIFNVNKNQIGIRVYISGKNVDKWLPYFKDHKEQIEKTLGHNLLWDPNPDNTDKIIALYSTFQLNDQENWGEAIGWLALNTIKFKAVFQELIRRN